MTNEFDYTDIDFQDIPSPLSLERREFLKMLGGGIFILFSTSDLLALSEAAAPQRRRPSLPDDFNAFLRIGEDGRVSCFTGKIEMGQGVITSLAQMLADELEVSLDAVDMVMGDTDLCPWDMGTFGSMTTRFFGPPLRAAAAEARDVLLELAAERLGVPKDRLTIESGLVFDTASRQNSVSFAQLAKGQKIARRLKEEAVLEAVTAFTIVGRPALRRDAVAKVTGQAKYSADLREPGMLYARVLRPPAHGAKLIRVDTSGAKKIPGTRVVEEEELIAVLHEDPEQAAAALVKITAEFHKPQAEVDEDSIFDHLLNVAPEAEVAAQGGDLAAGETASRTVISQTYLDGYVAHAPIETHTALAKTEGDRIVVYASTQTPFPLKDQVAQAVGLPPEKIRIIPPFVGGGFGGKTANRQALEAARLAQLTGRPVQVAWTRAEEFFYDTFRPAAIVKIKGGIGDSGRISLWDYGVYFAGQRGAAHYYDIPHHRTTAFGSGWVGPPGSHPFATGAWRAPSNNTNTFARESHIDVLAAAAGVDPLEFRLKNLKDKRMRRVLEALAEKVGWKPAAAPSGRGLGIATGIDAGTYVAHMAEVEVDKASGKIRVKHVVCVQEMGLCINPAGATIQMEGCITMGLGYALTEDIRFRGGDILDRNFDSYEIPRFSWLPQIETEILEDRQAPPQGGGEPAIIAMGAVIANAVYDAVGARVLRLPMTPERVKAAL
ncbi:MAG: molybdopterin cofactor-binding domain-containing protein [Candidatus Aminicenantaceae bacterium]